MGFFGNLVRKITGEESDGKAQAIKDEQLARLYEACSRGTLPVILNAPIILKRGETAHFVSPVAVIEQKTETKTYRGYAGTRLKIGDLPIYLGGSAPSKVSNEVMASVGNGHLIITSKRVVLSGTKINYSARLDQITNWKLFKDAIQILWEGKYGGRFYKMDDPRPAAVILQTVIQGVSPQPLSFIQAAVNGRTDLVKALLQGGADPDQRADEGYTALMFVSHNGDRSMADLLLDAGANVNGRANDGTTALMTAAFGGQIEMVRFLIARGADINAKADGGATAVTAASDGGHQEIVRLLLTAGANQAPESPGMPQGPDYFVAAAYEGRADLVEDLLNKGFDVDLTNQDGQTALMAAANQGHVDVLRILVQKGSAIDKKDKNGLTALMLAAAEGRAHAVTFLAEHGGKINAKGTDGVTPLMLAALNGHYEVVEVLIQRGANINAKTNDGGTALEAAVYGGHSKVVELLKAYGAKG